MNVGGIDEKKQMTPGITCVGGSLNLIQTKIKCQLVSQT